MSRSDVQHNISDQWNKTPHNIGDSKEKKSIIPHVAIAWDIGKEQSIGRCVYNNLFPQSNFRKGRCHFNDKILTIQRFHSTFS